MSRIKILYVHQDGRITGSAISLGNLLKTLREKGVYSISVMLAKNGPLKEYYEQMGIAVHVCYFPTFWTFPGPKFYQFAEFRQLFPFFDDSQLLNLVREINPDIIHINDKACVYAGMSLKKLDKPIVQHLRSSYVITNFWFNRYLSIKMINTYANKLIAISKDEIDGFAEHSNITIIHNSVDIDRASVARLNRVNKRRELSIDSAKLVVGMVGILNTEKGAWKFIEMAGKVMRKLPHVDLEFIIVGAVPDKLRDKHISLSPIEYANKLIEENELVGKVRIIGFREDGLEVMASFDIMVIANMNGVLGRQSFEAMAVGVPPVAFVGHNAAADIILDGETGFLVERGSVDALTEKVASLVADSDLRNQLSSRAIAHADKYFSRVGHTERIIEVYKELLP